MKKIVIVSMLLLSGCSTTVPVKAKFPDAPDMLMAKCPTLSQVKEDAKLSEIATTVSNNYTTYYECAAIVNGWQDWYQIQKNIYDNVGK
jgi:outer membrane murein-binding lipoprotein Lpp